MKPYLPGLKGIIFEHLFGSRAQTTVEFILIISVIVIAVAGVAYIVYDYIGRGVDAYSTDVSRILNNGHVK